MLRRVNSDSKLNLKLFPIRPVSRMPKHTQLPDFWKEYFKRADEAIDENFHGNLAILKNAYKHNDAYALQLEAIGYCFKSGAEKPAKFYNAIQWTLEKLNYIAQSGQLPSSDILVPAKAFEVERGGQKTQIFLTFGDHVPAGAKELNLLTPDVFVKMLSQGYFPIGAPIRENTNQTLCEHDLAHIAGFISCPSYMKAIRQAFRQVGELMKTNSDITKALSNFDSLYSLRLYYMIEVFSIIPEDHKEQLEKKLALKIKDFSLDNPAVIKPNVLKFLKSKTPAELNEYLYQVYESFPSLLNPLGGESRDILNRTRKFGRSKQSGSFYSSMSNLESKFDGSSIYSLWLNGKAALENIRSNHKDYEKAIEEIHAPLIASLLGTSQLSVEDWVLEAIKPVPDKNSKLYKYIYETGLWNKSQVLYWAYIWPDCTKVLQNSDFTKEHLYFEQAELEGVRPGLSR